MYKSIIIIIDESSQLEQVTSVIPKSDNIQRFFIFIGNRPTVGELSLIHNNDNYLILEDANKLGQLATEMTIRAGILYSQANFFIFCLSSNCPSITLIEQTFNKLEQNASHNIVDAIVGDKIIGVSRESLLFSGFDDIYKKMNQLITEVLNISSDIQYDLSQAMSGTPSPMPIVIQAIKEFVVLDKVSISQLNTKSPIIGLIKKEVLSYAVDKAKVVIFNNFADYSKLKKTRSEIPSDGAVIFIVNNSEQASKLPEPYQTLKVDTGEIVLIYVHEK